MTQKALRQEHLDFNEKNIETAAEVFGVKTLEDVYAYLGEGLKTTAALIRVIYPQHKSKPREKKKRSER